MKKFVETLKQTGRAIRAMNLPNKLTLLRVAIVPLYLVLLVSLTTTSRCRFGRCWCLSPLR